jgi:mannose-6-phosphate isomerase-like protein (cupin superfamily)
MKTSDGTIRPATQAGGAYWLGPGEGDARRVLDELDTFKATSEQTQGLFALKESRSVRGSGPPLHVHEREDEACYVIEGDVTLFIGDEIVSASAGSWIYLPRRTPHSLRIDSDQARMLWLIVPGGFDSFFTELFPAARADGTSDTEQPDVEHMAATAARYGVTILGPTPDK